MTDTADRTVPVSAEDIRAWLTNRVAFYLEVPADSILPDAKFVEMGLDSVYAMTMCGDIEDRFELEVEPTIAWDHPTVAALTAHLHDVLGRR
ncbi:MULTISPECIES: acyl carrier protein [unclassified Streptomyces]|uniref:acyl carrier protein n=1 Tax=unclassified Streptomyces TaxID=2593676 RepID=UPI002E13AF04|nr:acyl carrier protein [Streptomyces sp. NBC_01207]WTA18044.1 acyl carrier protein [Streptomyces sp. NBC_00853]